MDFNVGRVNFDAICRICLKNETFLTNLFQTDAPGMLKFCGFLEVDEFDELPDKICTTCNSVIIQSYELKRLCTSSKLYLQSLLKISENLEVDTIDCITEQEINITIADEGNVENKVDNNDQFLAECLKGGEQNISHEHCCNVKSNQSQNIQILKYNCDSNFDNDKMHESTVSEHPDHNEAPKENNDINCRYQCVHCKITFEHKQDMFVHQSIHEGDDNICNICKKAFRTMRVLKRHLKTHMITKSHVCKICNKGFAEASAVIKHERRLHLGIPREKNYECTDCGQRFTDQYYLKVHQRKHTGEKPLKCDICHKSFYDPRSLRVHLDAHKGIKPYLCNYCGKSFVQTAHLKQHIIVHTTEKPYICTLCNKRFTQSTSLRRHKKIHLKMHKCNICLDRFSRMHQLSRHKEEEHDIKTKRITKTDK